jgi:urea transporter
MENNCEVKPKPKTIKEFFKSRNFWKPFIAASIGGVLGYLYYHFVGCNSGSCAITSNPYMSIIMGGFLGFFLVNSPCTSGKC